MGLRGANGRLQRLVLGHHAADAAREAIRNDGDSLPASDAEEVDWNPELRRRLERYARGERIDFSDCEVDLPDRTPFQQRVLEATRRIPYGRTLTYAELAEQAGSPRAARAVGNVMKSNRVPLVIPCHRVVAAGDLGGYSAPQGVSLKARLLAIESPNE